MDDIEIRRESLKMALEMKRDFETIEQMILVADKIYQYLDNGLQN